ncbi:phage tail assembly chaperone [Mesobaculum littorinae]|uniref:Phage tail assembly chaperone n=2 Tax=Mesobaculum littorinae TaxID=2486419 RepID=A0A438AK91_9RHOB|nr:phage tail assembly chaperone [Mesobaculum littorinae]
MRAGIAGRGLAPEAFWRLTPAELMLILGGGAAAIRPLDRPGFEALRARFPDAEAPPSAPGGGPQPEERKRT